MKKKNNNNDKYVLRFGTIANTHQPAYLPTDKKEAANFGINNITYLVSKGGLSLAITKS
jgi:hypothetical protein